MPKGIYPRKPRPRKPKPVPVHKTPEERFWAKFDRSNPDACWEWQGKRMPKGYGQWQVERNGKVTYFLTHRFAWASMNGPIPDKMQVCHSCDNPPCCNPAHLFLGTNLDNQIDCVRKRRRTRGTMHPQAKITDSQVAEILRRRFNGESTRNLSIEFGLSISYTRQIILREKRLLPHELEV